MKIISVIGFFLLAHVCVSAQVEPLRGLIKGRVTDRVTRVTDTATPRPNNLADVLVTAETDMLVGFGPWTDRTDQAGNYEITDLAGGEYAVTASKAGYDDSTAYVMVISGAETFHDFRLYKAYPLATYFWNMGPIRWLLILCLLIVITYAVRRFFKRNPE